MRVSYKRPAVKDMEATRDYIAGRLKNPKAAKKQSQYYINPFILFIRHSFPPLIDQTFLQCSLKLIAMSL